MVRDRSLSSRMLDILVHSTLVLVLACTLLPILHVGSASLSSGSAYASGVTFYPRETTLQAYRVVFAAGTVPRALLNSALYTVVGTMINITLTSMMGFALSRRRLKLRRVYTVYVVIPMFFSGGMIPSFILVKSLGLYNTLGAMVLPGAITVWNLLIMRTFFHSVPYELDESALIDGARDLTIFLRIVLPVSQAAIATISLFYAVGHWNSWFSAMIYLRDQVRYPLQLVLRNIVIQGQMEAEFVAARDYGALMGRETTSQESIKYATICLSIAPMVIVYPFVQRYLVKGVMIGSLKG